MQALPVISVITPFYNPDPVFLREAIESVLRQTYADWELLLVDDGSSGESSALAQEYANTNRNRIRYLEHRNHHNRGMSASRNLGLQQSEGRYIAFLDADDVWLPQTLGEQLALLEAQPGAAMLYGNTEYWYSWTSKPEDTHQDFVPTLGVTPYTLFQPPALVPVFLEGQAVVPCTCAILVRRPAMEKVGGFEEAFPNLYEDQAFYFKICFAAPVLVSDHCWGRYRQHPRASTQQLTKNGGAERARLAFLVWLEGYMRQGQFHESEVWQALRRQKWLHRAPGRTGRAYRWVRWARKWLLRAERRLLPSPVRRWLWARSTDSG
jgi:glycosyltransferase involved in cell wall biosynthesis